MQYRICPECGAHLDFGERCDCHDKKEAAPLARERPQIKESNHSVAKAGLKVKPLGR